MNQPVPVLLMARQLNLGGSERQLTETAKSLDRSRFEPHVGCFHSDGLRGDELRAAGVPIVVFPVRSFYSPATLGVARQLGQYLRRNRIQLLHTFDVPATLFGVSAGRLFGTGIVLSSQRAHRDLTPGITRGLLRLTDRMVDGVVVNCEAVRRHLIEDEHVPPALIHLCENGVDTTVFRRDGASLHASGGSVVVGAVCALRPEKALTLLIDAFAEVRAAHPGIKLVIVGSGPSLPALEARCTELGLGQDCRFHPATANVVEWLRGIDIFVLPSISEALSNALMEAMACGCAVVASRVGGNPELVRHGCTGLLFESGDVQELAGALRTLIDQPLMRAKVGAAAAASMREEFSTAAATKRIETLYSTFLERRR